MDSASSRFEPPEKMVSALIMVLLRPRRTEATGSTRLHGGCQGWRREVAATTVAGSVDIEPLGLAPDVPVPIVMKSAVALSLLLLTSAALANPSGTRPLQSRGPVATRI